MVSTSCFDPSDSPDYLIYVSFILYADTNRISFFKSQLICHIRYEEHYTIICFLFHRIVPSEVRDNLDPDAVVLGKETFSRSSKC